MTITIEANRNSSTQSGSSLPSLLHAGTRAGDQALDPLLVGITAELFELESERGERSGQPVTLRSDGINKVLALEAEDGTTLFMRADALAEAIRERDPELPTDTDSVALEYFGERDSASRGLGGMIWKRVWQLSMPDRDSLIEEALALAKRWAREQFGESVGESLYDAASYLGAKALMWQIESRLVGQPGLYHWQEQTLRASDHCRPTDDCFKAARAGQPILVLIHGTGSNTVGSFSDLRSHKPTWERLTRQYPGGIFGFEHRTFSESPIDNALTLLNALPQGARVSLLTHSRGGLVGDLLALGRVEEGAIERYRLERFQIDGDGDNAPRGLEQAIEQERQHLRTLRDRLAQGGITLDRYLRVAAPANGTRLLSANLDAALSLFLNLVQQGVGTLVGFTTGLLAGVPAGKAAAAQSSSALGVIKRLILEVARRRWDPRLLPGIAAMRVDSPLAAFLADPEVQRRDGVRMAVIAGDTEFPGVGITALWRRIANLFADWQLFDHEDNDLVVDSDAMFAGLANRAGAYYLFDQGRSVTHFRYFRNDLSRDGLRDWLTTSIEPSAQQSERGLFRPLTESKPAPWRAPTEQARRDGDEARPVVILIPGFMGSHLELNRRDPTLPGSGDRIWLDRTRLMRGDLARLGDPQAQVAAELSAPLYGDLAEYLAASHTLVPFPYDWRLSLTALAKQLDDTIRQQLDEHPDQPIRLLAHGMGGLIARMVIARHRQTWKRLVESGAVLVMLGTPNHGSHLMLHTLLGRSRAIRQLALLDAHHSLQRLAQMVASFPGALALLPEPDFNQEMGDGVVASASYYQQGGWQSLQDTQQRRWFDHGIETLPDTRLLNDARSDWQHLAEAEPMGKEDSEHIAYIFGRAARTPCGVRRRRGRLEMLYTTAGDGVTTWGSGRLSSLPPSRYWYRPVEHADLTSDPSEEKSYFAALLELLTTGSTTRLSRLPERTGAGASRSGTHPSGTHPSGAPRDGVVLADQPPSHFGALELERAFFGSSPRARQSARLRELLEVDVYAGDIRFVDQPVLCGHYRDDVISGAEKALDELLDGQLSEQEQLGIYADDIGTNSVVLRRRNREERERKSRHGAVIVGLGHYDGYLSARHITESVRIGLLRLLLVLRSPSGVASEEPIELYSLLIGTGSTTNITVAESVSAVTRAVLLANQQFKEVVGHGRAISKLHFIELYRDIAILAAEAVSKLPEQFDDELAELGMQLRSGSALREIEGVLPCHGMDENPGHWSRLIVVDADPPEEGAPLQTRRSEKRRHGVPRLKYIFLSQRARAETTWQPQQPKLIKRIVEAQRQSYRYDPRLGHLLFQLMVPRDYKAAAGDLRRIILVLDHHTADLPWELLQVEPRQETLPLVIQTPVLRQLESRHYRRTVQTAHSNSVCIIANPDTRGIDRSFPEAGTRLSDLPGALEEGKRVAERFHHADGQGWEVVTSYQEGALEVLETLYAQPYRILSISAHGLFEAKGSDDILYTGVALSDGLLITAVEIEQMEVVPELVFINCCHLGRTERETERLNPLNTPDQLAYSLARKLIEMGVRCVVVAGWAVDDRAACTFADTLFEQLLSSSATFADALFKARQRTYRSHTSSNTWGAYQAYGDPNYRLRRNGASDTQSSPRCYVALEQLISAINAHKSANRRAKSQAHEGIAQLERWIDEQLARAPDSWRNNPSVCEALAELFSESGEQGHPMARDYYQHAIRYADRAAPVAIRAILRLANLESHEAVRIMERTDADEGSRDKRADAFIDRAIARLEQLEEVTREQADRSPARDSPRASYLGSAYKRKGVTVALQHRGWSKVEQWLRKARSAYLPRLDGRSAKLLARNNPYTVIRGLQLAYLIGELSQQEEEVLEIAELCRDNARQIYAEKKAFWSAAQVPDSELLSWLIDPEAWLEREQSSRPCDEERDSAELLTERYNQAFSELPQASNERDSVMKQWQLLIHLLRYRADSGPGRDRNRDSEQANTLERVLRLFAQ